MPNRGVYTRFLFSFIFAALLLILQIRLCYAFGMASSYLPDNKLYLLPGEVAEYKVELQNSEEYELNARFSLEKGIAKIKGNTQEFKEGEEAQGNYIFEEYTVGKDNKIREITLLIAAPEDAKAGDSFWVRYSAYPLSDSQTPISLNLKLSKEFEVIIKEGQAIIKETGKTADPETKDKIEKDKERLIIPAFIIIGMILGISSLFFMRKSIRLTSGLVKKWKR